MWSVLITCLIFFLPCHNAHIISSIRRTWDKVKTPDLNLGAEDCILSPGNRCRLSDFKLNSTSSNLSYINVYPGGVSRCIDRHSPYRFLVYPGSRQDQVLVQFQDGGGVWNQPSTLMGLTETKTFVPRNPFAGIFNSSDERNPYRHYTKILVLYCSGR